VRRLSILLCITLAVFFTSLVCAEDKTINDSNLINKFPTFKSSFPIKLSWLTGDYDFDQIEEYIGGYYTNYYKSWERYLIDKQREFASTFGLTSVLFKPDFRQYENTKLILSKNIWDDKLAFRYVAPIGDMTEFDISIAFKPHRFVTFVGKGNLNGNGSALVLLNKPFGLEKNGKNSSHKSGSKLTNLMSKLVKRY
jgi:hypothetical protein